MSGEGASRTTVVIPVWGRYVNPRFQEALASLSAQQLRAPVVIVDNASDVPLPPAGEALLIRSEQRLTLGAARNLGLAQVRTPNVVFWDADDLMPAGTLDFMQTAIESDPRLVAFGMALTEDPSGSRHRWPRPWVARLVRFSRALALINSVWSVFPANGPVVMRTDAVRACGGYPDSVSGDDWSLSASLLFHGRVGWSERPGCLYLQHLGSNSDSHSTVRTMLANAGFVRAQLRSDVAVPRWVRSSLPLLAAAQWTAVGAHLVVAASRRSRAKRLVET